MVNYGVSRACETCRKRRKKYDEGRPTCSRCAKAGRVCLGYRSEDQLHFRYHAAPVNAPVQTPLPPISEIYTTDHAVRFFLDQYVVRTTDTRISRGFLHGLPSLLANAEPYTDLVQAVEIVAWASLGNQFSWPDLLVKARKQYITLLQSFQVLLLSCQLHSPTVEALVIVILLGMYEIVSSADLLPEQQQHVAHVRGVYALLLSDSSPFDLRSSTQLFQVASPLLARGALQNDHTAGVLCAPASNNTVRNLGQILIECHSLFERVNTQLQNPQTPPTDLQETFAKALRKEYAFSQWDTNLDTSWQANTIGYVTEAEAQASSCPFCWHGAVHSYFDVYVAAVMNTYRKTYLMLLEALIRTASHINPVNHADTITNWTHEARLLADDIVASVPYHLTSNLRDYLRTITSQKGTPRIGRSVGGLLLLHPLYVLSTSSILHPPMQSYVKSCLAWIGQYMEIGQGTLMSKVNGSQGYAILPFQEMAEEHVLIWAGMLLQPIEKRECGAASSKQNQNDCG
ncbi:conserved hypothetical protein [Talaromyces stipitatus ATCC 10500]|uniref:Zn(2)-C6 fungal-type domain-containing protein n=1 Tax=Talaromyces stipitatus (strain ATCC 10500 / CBS 375.48 / QM 6759 / NRRL 1006) TaxID=441959 RepID=B8MKW1_TALSN|nr:uncharacterized protein TSTA_044260 [Talaromyces stipitatus ATCC 10500]EED14960.1 conserved hypothetical protein [Talaromyces stipitatus ATCC 10500]